jgi:CBS domain-containing protein
LRRRDLLRIEYPDASIAFALRTGTEPAADPTNRIGKLVAANQKPCSVKPNDPVSKAVNLMANHGFSQLPVTTSDREVKGVITWKSICIRLCLQRPCTETKDAMVRHQEISANASLFDAIRIIAEHEYVLIRARDNNISGIVTTSDLSAQFGLLAEPFLLLGEIENYIRRLLRGKFTEAELASARDPQDSS